MQLRPVLAQRGIGVDQRNGSTEPQSVGSVGATSSIAAFLGTGAGQVFAQQVKQRATGWYIKNRHDFTAPDELDRLGAGGCSWFSAHDKIPYQA